MPAEAEEVDVQPDIEAALEQEGFEHEPYSIDNQVFLRAEFISESEMKGITVSQSIGEALAFAVLILNVIYRCKTTDRQFLRSKVPESWNVAVSGLCLLANLACIAVFGHRLHSLRGKRWSHRRLVRCITSLTETSLQAIAIVSVLIPNIYVLTTQCRWTDPVVKVFAFIKWSAFNTIFMIIVADARNLCLWKRNGKPVRRHHRDALMLDAPLTVHYPLILNWVFMECVTIALLVDSLLRYQDRFTVLRMNGDLCTEFDYDCSLETETLILLCFLFASWFVWIALWIMYITRSVHQLRSKPYSLYKVANISVHVQIRSRFLEVLLFVLCVVLLCFWQVNSCTSFIETWLGFSPMLVLETTMNLSTSYYFMPKTPDLLKPLEQMLLQEFAWTEEEKKDKLEARNARGQVLGGIREAPMFCFESAVKTFYFSAMIYTIEEEEDHHGGHGEGSGGKRLKRSQPEPAQNDDEAPSVAGYTLNKAMSLYRLERYQVLVEPKEDTRVLLAWSKQRIVLTFRGTASLANVLADLQVWRHIHPPKRGRWLTRPRVHAGFLASWTANALNERVLCLVAEILRAMEAGAGDVTVLCTGHSLGGALATLCAIDLVRRFPELLQRHQVQVYTFGAPRTGNHSFARDYNRICPETWHVINPNDIVPRSGKFFRLYKRPGQRVLVNDFGDMIVRPAFVELTAQVLPFRSSVANHLLATYQRSLIAICRAQLSTKAFRDGIAGFKMLMEDGDVREVLKEGGVEFDNFERLAQWGGDFAVRLGGGMQQGLKQVRRAAAGNGGEKGVSGHHRHIIRCHSGICERISIDASVSSVADKDDGVAPTEASVSEAPEEKRDSQGELLNPEEQAPSTHSTPDPDAFAASADSNRSGQPEAPSRAVSASVETSVSGCASDCKEPSSQPSRSCMGAASSSSSRSRQTSSHRFAFLHHTRSKETSGRSREGLGAAHKLHFLPQSISQGLRKALSHGEAAADGEYGLGRPSPQMSEASATRQDSFSSDGWLNISLEEKLDRLARAGKLQEAATRSHARNETESHRLPGLP